MHAFAGTEKCAQRWWPNAIAAFGSGHIHGLLKPDLRPEPALKGVRARVLCRV